MLGHLTIGKS